MTADKQISRKLAALTEDQRFEDGAMVLGAAGNPDALALVLQAIDDTVLPRNLTFKVAEASVTLSVGGRRLRSLVGAVAGSSSAEDLQGKLLSKDDTPDLEAIKNLLSELVCKPGALTVAAAAATARGGQSDTGVGIATLSELWGVDPDGTPPSRVDRFLRGLQGDLLATIRLGDDASEDGEPEMIAAMKSAYQTEFAPLLDEHDGLRADPDGDFCMTLEGHLPSGALLSFLTVDNSQVIVATVSEAWPRISLSWSMG